MGVSIMTNKEKLKRAIEHDINPKDYYNKIINQIEKGEKRNNRKGETRRKGGGKDREEGIKRHRQRETESRVGFHLPFSYSSTCQYSIHKNKQNKVPSAYFYSRLTIYTDFLMSPCVLNYTFLLYKHHIKPG